MTFRLPDASQQAAADAVVDRLDAGSGAGILRFWSGSAPADADTAATGTLLLEVTLSDPAYGAANSSGTAALSGTPSGTGTAAASTGTDAGYCRGVDSDGNTVFQGDVTVTGGGGDVTLDNINIAEGQTVTLTSLPYTQPAA